MALNPEFEKIGYDIIHCAYKVRNAVGNVLLESFYRSALAYELRQLNYVVEEEKLIPCNYDGVEIAHAYRADIVVDRRVVIEIKAISGMGENECRQIFTYMKLMQYRLGYLINFGVKNFKFGNTKEGFPMRNGLYRFVNNI